MVSKDHDRIGSHGRSDSRDGQIGERGPHTLLQKKNSTYTVAIGGYVRICWFSHDAHKASPWFQRSVVNLAPPQEWRGSSLLPKLVAKLFLVLVAMARFLVASLIWDITATMDLTLMERGNLRKQWMVYSFAEWVSKRIWCKSYSDQFGNSQRSLLSPTVGLNNIPPNTENWLRKRYYENGRQQHEQWDQAWDQLQHEQQVKQQHAQRAHHLSMNAERALLYTCSSCLTPHRLKISVLSFHLHSHPWAHLFEFASPLLLPPVLPCLLLFLPPPALRACTLSSTTWSPCKTCATPRTRGVTTPTTSPSPWTSFV